MGDLDGTAAVCAEGRSIDESRSLGNWEGRIGPQMACAILCVSQKTCSEIAPATGYGNRGAIVAENRPRQRMLPRPAIFRDISQELRIFS